MKKIVLIILSFILLTGCKIYFVTINVEQKKKQESKPEQGYKYYQRFGADFQSVYGCRKGGYFILPMDSVKFEMDSVGPMRNFNFKL